MRQIGDRAKVIPERCPACGSNQIVPTAKVKTQKQIQEHWNCNDCNTTWHVVYKFHAWGMSNVSILDRPKENSNEQGLPSGTDLHVQGETGTGD